MQHLSKKTFIAIEAVLYVACHSSDRPVRSKDICNYQGVTLRYLEHIMQQLVHDGILKGIRGPRGGYVLARDRRKILLCDIYDSMLKLQDETDSSVSSGLCTAVIEPLQLSMREKIRKELERVNILDLYDQARAKAVDVVLEQRSDFSI